MLALVRGKRPFQVAGQVALACPGSDAIAQHLPGNLQYTVRQVVRAASFDCLYCLQYVGRFQVRDRGIANLGEQVGFQSSQYVVGVLGVPGMRLLAEPFTSDGLKRVSSNSSLNALVRLVLDARVDALRQQLASFVAPLACFGQSDRRVLTTGKALFLSIKSVLESPQFAAGRRHFDVEAVCVPQAHWFVAALCILDRRI